MTMEQKKLQETASGALKSPGVALSVDEDHRTPPHLLSPEDRAEKVRVLKKKVQSGEYRPDTLEVAFILTRFLDPEE